MNSTFLKAASFINLAAILCLVAPAARAGVVYIDKLTTLQTNAVTYDSSTNTTVASVNSVGGFRTIDLTSTGNDNNFEDSKLRVFTNSASGGPRIVLGSGADATANFTVTWGGANGTAGLGGMDFADGITNLSLLHSTLNFSLLTADLPSNITWAFTDSYGTTATYTQLLNPKPSFNPITSPAIQYAISLASFTGGGSIDWSSIDFITLSGGGVPSLDMSLGGAFSINATAPIPEPGTWAAAGLLLLTAMYIRTRRMRATPSEEAPVAA